MNFNSIEELLEYTKQIKGRTFKEFDENIRTVVSRWTFPKVKSGTIVVYVPIQFFE